MIAALLALVLGIPTLTTCDPGDQGEHTWDPAIAWDPPNYRTLAEAQEHRDYRLYYTIDGGQTWFRVATRPKHHRELYLRSYIDLPSGVMVRVGVTANYRRTPWRADVRESAPAVLDLCWPINEAYLP
jgi:hypothetical protein